MRITIFLILILFGCNNNQGIKQATESSYLLVRENSKYTRKEMRMNSKTVNHYNRRGINTKREYFMNDQILGYSEFIRENDGTIKSYKSYNAKGQLTSFSKVIDEVQFYYDQGDNLLSYTKMTKSDNWVVSHEYDSSDNLLSISTNKFDSLENLIYSKMIHFRNEEPDTVIFQIEYKEFDEYGNWTKRSSSNGFKDAELKVDERQIEYY